MRDEIDHALVDLLLCASDLARRGFAFPLAEVVEALDGCSDKIMRVGYEARAETLAVAPCIFEYRNDLLADTILEAAYRVAEGRGIGGVA